MHKERVNTVEKQSQIPNFESFTSKLNERYTILNEQKLKKKVKNPYSLSTKLHLPVLDPKFNVQNK